METGKDNYPVGLLGGSGPYPTVSPPSSLVSSVADPVNLEVRKSGIKFPDHVEFKYDADTPLSYASVECAELIRQMRGGPRDIPASDGSMNFAIEKYNTALKDTLAQLGKAEKLARVRGEALTRKSSQKERFLERFGELKDKFKSSRERVKELEREKAVLEAEKATLEEEKRDVSHIHMRDINRLKESRSFEVTHKRKCLEALKANGLDSPSLIQEKHFELEAKRLDVGEIPETDLSLSPLLLDSPFINKHVLAGLDPYGSNAGLVDPGTAVILRTPSSSHGEQSGDRLDDPTPFVELDAGPAANELVASKETSNNAPQLGGKVVTSTRGTQVGEGVLEISDSSSEDRSERDPVERTTGSELDGAEKSLGARSEPVETVEATLVDEQTEGISIDPPDSSADVPDGSVPPVANASED
ncbi:hypothetical protein F2Q70_00038678 [Brassica cretica]|uniref:DUF1204 domain-containing protein n=1 Tax=Brassica cretica TaxID=69181 RepID=A0A8S9K576_BRACR|nr:hypothetical protein F2Q70_00038678 [Brassica cretica]